MYTGSVFTNHGNQTTIIMKLRAKARFARLWIMLLFTCLSMVSVSAVVSAVQIGDEYDNDHRYLGGIAFYVDGTGKHGLVAAKSDIQNGMTWIDAELACENLVSNGYSDWFLPNKEQLRAMYNIRSAVGCFVDDGYWSSTEYSATTFAWFQGFGNGYQGVGYENVEWRVRPVWVF